MTLFEFLTRLKSAPQTIAFTDTMAVIEAHYDFTPARFKNGEAMNAAGANNGSCKIFAFGQLHALTPAQVLDCFGDYYRVDVLQNPHGTDHGNIRNFIKSGWGGIIFEAMPLTLKNEGAV